jgi:hypothetical protein
MEVVIHRMRDRCASVRHLAGAVVAVALAVMSIAGMSGVAIAVPAGLVVGCVCSDNGSPISGAHVTAYDWETDLFVGEAQTGEDGTYSIGGLELARYRIKAEAARYLPEYYGEGAATPVTVIPPYSTDNIDFTLAPGSSISGHVYQSDRETPISGARVAAYVKVGDLWEYAADGYADSKGSYSITTGTGKGTYRVRAQAAGFAAAYYCSIPDYAPATEVRVTTGGDIAGIDFTLTEIGFISGTVYRADGLTPISGSQIVAYDNATGDWVGEGFSGANAGHYYINLRPGTYRLKAEAAGYLAEWYADVTTFGAATAVSVAGLNEEPNISFTLQRVLGVTTGPAGNLTTTSARLNGSLISLGMVSDVTVSFIWGTATGSYPHETPRQVRNSEGPISFELSGLTPGTTCYYRAMAVGNADAVYGEERSFTTVDDAAPVMSEPICMTTSSVATIMWIGNEATKSQIDYGLTEDYDSTTGWSADFVRSQTVKLTELSADSTYHYRIICKDASGNKTVSGDRSFTTDAALTTTATVFGMPWWTAACVGLAVLALMAAVYVEIRGSCRNRQGCDRVFKSDRQT